MSAWEMQSKLKKVLIYLVTVVSVMGCYMCYEPLMPLSKFNDKLTYRWFLIVVDRNMICLYITFSIYFIISHDLNKIIKKH